MWQFSEVGEFWSFLCLTWERPKIKTINWNKNRNKKSTKSIKSSLGLYNSFNWKIHWVRRNNNQDLISLFALCRIWCWCSSTFLSKAFNTRKWSKIAAVLSFLVNPKSAAVSAIAIPYHFLSILVCLGIYILLWYPVSFLWTIILLFDLLVNHILCGSFGVAGQDNKIIFLRSWFH